MSKIRVPKCPKCGQMMIFTFVFPYQEYACLPCGEKDEFLARNEMIEVSEKEHDKKKKLWGKDLEVLTWRLNGSGVNCGDCEKKINEGDCETCRWGKEQAKNKDYKFEFYKRSAEDNDVK